MAVYPTPGGSSGTWGSETRAFHGVTRDLTTGKILDGALMQTSAAPTVDAGVANKKYVDDGGARNINGGTPTVVHTIYFNGVTTAGATFSVSHGISSAITKILHVSGGMEIDAKGTVDVYDHNSGSTTGSFRLKYDATNVTFDGRGTATDGAGNQYWIRIDYID